MSSALRFLITSARTLFPDKVTGARNEGLDKPFGGPALNSSQACFVAHSFEYLSRCSLRGFMFVKSPLSSKRKKGCVLLKEISVPYKLMREADRWLTASISAPAVAVHTHQETGAREGQPGGYRASTSPRGEDAALRRGPTCEPADFME